MPASLPPEPFCYEAHALQTGKYLGCGKNTSIADHEGAFVFETFAWSTTFGLEVHIEEISYEQYETSFGRVPDWRGEWNAILATRI